MRNLIIILILMPLFTIAKLKKTISDEVILMNVTVPAKASETIEFSSQAGGRKMVQYYLNGAALTKKTELSEKSWKKWVEIRNKANKKEGHVMRELPNCQYQLWVETNVSLSSSKKLKDQFKKETWCLIKKNKKLNDLFYNAFREVQALSNL